MMMALGALHANAKEELCCRLGLDVGACGEPIVVGWSLGERAALCRDDLADHLIHRLAIAQAGADPVVEAPHPLVLNGIAIDPQQIPPLIRPEIDELRAVEHLVDRLLSLVRTLVGEESLDVVQAGQSAYAVKVDAAEELLVRRQK